jgi:hypothetical protein
VKRQYRLTDAELQSILDCSKPVPMIMLHISTPESPQDRANRAWQSVAQAHGFVWDSAEPAETGDDHDLLAEPIPPVEPVCAAVDEVNAKERKD